MADCLQEAERCAHRFDRYGTMKNLKEAMNSAGYNLTDAFERVLTVLYFGSKNGLQRDCSNSGVKGPVPGWNGAATTLRDHMSKEGIKYVSLFYRVKRIIDQFNHRVYVKKDETGKHICDYISFKEVKEVNTDINPAEEETKVIKLEDITRDLSTATTRRKEKDLDTSEEIDLRNISFAANAD